MAKLIKSLPALSKDALVAFEPKFKVFLKYARVELAPPSPVEIPAAVRQFRQLITSVRRGAWRDVTVRQAWINTIVTAEVFCWFFVGEIIGKRQIIGYTKAPAH